MPTVAFLRHIWADEGYRCITVRQKDFYKNNFFRTTEEAAAFALKQDALGHTVYHACATFRTNENRKQANVLFVKCFWQDIDVGSDKPYRLRSEASAALTEFLVKTNLPEPTIVHSGPAGMHIYLILEEAITWEEWRPRADAYRALCKQLGLHVDTARSSDASSVLRPPGTHNRKALVHPVTVAHWSSPVALIDLPFTPIATRKLQPQADVQHPRMIDNATIYNDIPSDPNKVADRCAQLRYMRDHKGQMPEPEWFLCCQVLHHCQNGDAVAHEWSKGDPRYNFDQTQGKLDRSSGPPMCATFQEHNGLCEGCEFKGKIGGPIQLGRNTAQNFFAQQMNGVETVSKWINDEHGLRFRTESKKGDPVEELISSFPIMLDNVCYGERTLSDYSLNLNMTTPHNVVPMPMSAGMFFSSQGMPELHRMGAVIHNADLLRKYVREMMDAQNKQNAPHVRFEQCGWKNSDTAFLVGNKLYTADKVITCAVSPDIERRTRMLGPRGGTLAAWSAAANQLFATGCEPHSFAVCCSFGAPLMHFHSEEGGAIVNLVSEQSATGKTTSLEAVASVWGELNGLKLTDEDTKVSRGLLLGTLGNLPCVFDELHKRDPDTIREFIIMFTNGRDKLRARTDGTLRNPGGEWQTILVLGSNLSIVDITQTKVTEEAQAFRILEFSAEQNFTGHEGDRLRRQLRENSGWAGDAYMRYLLHPDVLNAAKKDLDYAMQALWEGYGFDKKHRFWVRTLACATVGGRLAVKLGLLDFNVLRIVNWAIDRCKERISGETPRTYVQVLNEMLYELYPYTLVTDIEWSGPKKACQVLNHALKGLYARRVRDTGRMYISRTWLRQWLTEHQVNRTGFTKELFALRILVNPNKFITLGAGTNANVGGQIMCYEIDMHHPEMMGTLQAAELAMQAPSIEPPPASVSPPQSLQ